MAADGEKIVELIREGERVGYKKTVTLFSRDGIEWQPRAITFDSVMKPKSTDPVLGRQAGRKKVGRKKKRIGLAPDKYLSGGQRGLLKEYLDRMVKLHANSRRIATNTMIVDLMAHSGLRAEELCELKVKDAQVKLPVRLRKMLIYVADGKGNVARAIQVKASLIDRLERYVKRWRKGARLGSYLFVRQGSNSLPLSYNSLYGRIRRLGEKAGLGRLTPHMLRHTYATLLQAKTGDTRMIQKLLGHANLNTTMIYTDVPDDVIMSKIEGVNFL